MKSSSCVTLVAILAAMQSAEANAAEGSEDGREIIVTATRSGTALEDLATSVSVVGLEELSQQLDYDTNIMRALEFSVPGIAPQRESRSNCTPNIRGRQTSIQINGIPVNENIRQSTCNQMYQLSPFSIERIEVLRGGTALYGAGSPGGIINFVTRRAKGKDLESIWSHKPASTRLNSMRASRPTSMWGPDRSSTVGITISALPIPMAG